MMPHALPYDVNCSILFTELPLLQRPQAAQEAGFDAVEFWWPFAEPVPSDRDLNNFVMAVQDAGVQLVSLNFAAGDMPAGDRGWLSIPSKVSEFRDHLDVAFGIGQLLGVSRFNALYGNRSEKFSPDSQDETALENLLFAARVADVQGARILLEPLSGTSAYPLKSSRDVLAVIERVRESGGWDNVDLLLDIYHLSVNGEDVSQTIRENVARIGHVQIADAPGRGAPGTGNLALDALLSALEDAGYAGWVGLEYVSNGATAASMEWLPSGRRGVPGQLKTQS